MTFGIITDELHDDLARALDACQQLGLRHVELRTVEGVNVSLLESDAVSRVGALVRENDMVVTALGTPLLKCTLPDHPGVAGARHGTPELPLDDHWELLRRAADTAAELGAPFVRAFSCWRVERTDSVRDAVAELLARAVDIAREHGAELLLENEHDCNVGTASESAWMLESVPGLRLIWDPGNAVRAGDDGLPAGFERLLGRIAHVHAKDVDDHGRWVALGAGRVDFASLTRSLADTGYDGVISLEPHHAPPGRHLECAATALKYLQVQAGQGSDRGHLASFEGQTP